MLQGCLPSLAAPPEAEYALLGHDDVQWDVCRRLRDLSEPLGLEGEADSDRPPICLQGPVEVTFAVPDSVPPLVPGDDGDERYVRTVQTEGGRGNCRLQDSEVTGRELGEGVYLSEGKRCRLRVGPRDQDLL